MKSSRLILLSLLCSAASLSHADILYQTSFEDPDFHAGPIGNQESWAGQSDANFLVSSDHVKSGSQSVSMDTSPLFGDLFAWRSLVASGGVIRASVDVFVETTTSQLKSEFGLVTIDENEDWAGNITLRGNGKVWWGNSEEGAYVTTTSLDSWHTLSMEFDYDHDTAKGFLDGVQVGDALPLLSEFHVDTDLYALASGFDKGYYDNYKIESVPEPATLAALSIGAVALMRRRKAN